VLRAAHLVRYPLHARALERHAAWARDFAAAGDLDAAVGEMYDIRALTAELRVDEDDDAIGWV
jgi:hypothetical protein